MTFQDLAILASSNSFCQNGEAKMGNFNNAAHHLNLSVLSDGSDPFNSRCGKGRPDSPESTPERPAAVRLAYTDGIKPDQSLGKKERPGKPSSSKGKSWPSSSSVDWGNMRFGETGFTVLYALGWGGERLIRGHPSLAVQQLCGSGARARHVHLWQGNHQPVIRRPR